MAYRLLTAAAALALGATGVYAAAQASTPVPATSSTRQQQTQQRLERRLDKRFARLDTNQDGVISRDEWPGRPGLFDRIDADHDGTLTKDEVQQALQARVARIHARVQTRVDARFAKIDKNQDGVISRDEWPGQAARFDRLDANHDGVLSKDEVRPAVSRLVLRRLAMRRLLIGR